MLKIVQNTRLATNFLFIASKAISCFKLLPLPIRLCSSKIPTNPLESHQTGHLQSDRGAIFERKPFKIDLEEGKNYSWCACGKSKNQPLCDGTHKNVHLKIKMRPVRFTVEKTGTYWLCNCKQTNRRPFCDGTHKNLPA